MRKIIIDGCDDGIKNYERRKNFYRKNGWAIKDEDESGCVVERINRAGYIIQIQLMVENSYLYETEL